MHKYQIKFNCTKCGKLSLINKTAIGKRRYYPNEKICISCYRKISPGGRYGKEYYPKELQKIWRQEIWDYEIVKPYLKELRTKKLIRFICEICGKEDIRSLNEMKNRKICGYRPICRKCALVFAVNSDEWIKNNSKAQLIAQNRPEVLEKQRQAQIRLMENDPLYVEKRASKSYISGIIEGMRFDSSWEMFYIGYCIKNPDIKSIKRYVGKIEYIKNNGCKSFYYPDFVVKFKNGKSKIIEIKGSKKYNHFHEKFNAAKKKWGVNYIVYGQKELYKLGILVRKKRYWKYFFEQGYNVVFNKNSKSQNFVKEIKKWQK